jgi:hypothetical protein
MHESLNRSMHFALKETDCDQVRRGIDLVETVIDAIQAVSGPLPDCFSAQGISKLADRARFSYTIGDH